MHMADALVSPAVGGAMWAASAGVIAYCSKKLNEKPDDAVESEVAGLFVKAAKSDHQKCARCWHLREDVGSNPEHPDVCGRCIDNLQAPGETRRFA